MRKSKIILAGALAFDLGVMVVAGHAAETSKGPGTAPAPAKNAAAVDYFLKLDGVSKHKTDIELLSFRIDSVNTVAVCNHKSGKVANVSGVPTCQFPKASNK